MKHLYIFLSSLALLLPACTTSQSSTGIYRPTLATQPKTYLANFPLNKATEQEVIQAVGTPDKSYSDGETTYATIDIAPKQASHGVIEYTYEITNGVVTNVRYLNSGNFFGVTQRESATLLQGQ